jgi:TonB family protein
MLKVLIYSLFFAISFALVSSGAAQRPEVRVEHDDRDFTWDKRQLDAPPFPVGGPTAFTRYLDYPRELRRRRVESKSIASVTVDAKGRVTAISFRPHMNPELEQIVRRAVLHCEWRPGRRKGVAKAGTLSFPMNFVISFQ